MCGIAVDVQVSDEGTLVLFTPLTEFGIAFIDMEVETEPYQFFGDALAVDHRQAEGLIEFMRENGVVVR
jgi:hypothetical protein